MFALCQQWEKSEKTRAIFCNEQGITLATFSYWRTKYRKGIKDTQDGFVAITGATSTGLEICYPNGVVLKVNEHISIERLKVLIGLY
jgi:hypothetical protein